MKIEYKTCRVPFSDGSENYKKGDKVLILPELSTETEYCVGTDFCRPVKIDKKYFKD
jgi:hypothetical protein